MKKLLLVAMCAMVLAFTMGAQVKNGTMWTDGFAFYKANVKKNGKVVMDGGTLHEGGYQFVMTHTKGNSYKVHPADPEFEYISLGNHVKDGYKIVLEDVAGIKVLACYNPQGEQVAMLQQFDGDLAKFMETDKIVSFAGIYEGAGGVKYTITRDGKYSVNKSTATPYAVMRNFEIPCNIVRLADGTYVQLDQTVDGLKAMPCKLKVSDGIYIEEYDGTDMIYQLERMPVANGMWPFASERLLSMGILCDYDKTLLRLMRNEIYARHGWSFSDPELKFYFESQPWYINLGDNSRVTLTPLEKKNVQSIKMVENFPED
ncbi:MAG: YARHG domain-containing protein [Muribaculaceae bacterium]|nr:YARHG domain-containing protein [Muribaculaceae bacterium]